MQWRAAFTGCVATGPALLHPDIVLPDSPFDGTVAVNALLAWVRGGSVPSST